ncbi:hypothetical protein [Pseudomonas nitroreducens]|uniref:hypothetical protein n=1 Tax=Pseudomonas nitroreducens TaxID=46680 RepID=UPI000B70FEED|nr:hypothetical protein [Pseudomonas nitroreducens]SNT46988.1 hypothetical protein SAMN05216209_5463 [Pseudomonas nitroreducens]
MDEQDVSPTLDVNDLEALIAEQMRWASVQLPLHDVAQAVPELIEDLSRFSASSSVALLSGILTEPDYQSNVLRLELLIALAFVHARGDEQPRLEDAARWFELIGQSRASCGEDPAEDVFVTLVTNSRENFLLLEGLWESAGFYTQCMLDLLARMPDAAKYNRLRDEVRALLVVSDLVCQQAGLSRYQIGSDEVVPKLDLDALPSAKALQRRVTLPFELLAKHGVRPDHLAPFISHPTDRETILTQEPGLSFLDRRPLLSTDSEITVALPTAVSTAVRDHVIDFVMAEELVRSFNINFGRVLSHKIFETRLFGSEPGCPVQWFPSGSDQFTSALISFDEGYFVVLHFALPSIETHQNGRFKHMTQSAEELEESLERAIYSTTNQIESTEGFRAGLHLIVLCGWGKGMAISTPPVPNALWRKESISIADLIRLSEINSMEISRFWRLGAAVHGLREAGVKIANVNGVMNLIGWVDLNDGHLVPHADLADGRVSPETPLLITPPLNLLRDVRAKADQARDFHIATDIYGEPHCVERFHKNPLFPNQADARIYVSLDYLEQRKLVAVCEGTATIWVHLETPAIESRDLIYRLWEMLAMRVAHIVDALAEVAALQNTYEFLYRFEDPEEDIERPNASATLAPDDCVRFEITSEQSATIYLEAGFTQAFRTPANIAERAIVKATLQAIQSLSGGALSSRLATEALRTILPNEHGRQFHLMHAHAFTDYISSTLPSKALEVDDIDSARLRLGLGWSVHDGDNTVSGATECSTLLNSLVDKRVEHVTAQLGRLDRTNLIQRLLINHVVGEVAEQLWKRTSGAVLGIHGDTPNTRRTVVEQLSKSAAAQISSRVLIEMALCAAPLSGGREAANLEIESLLAEIRLLIRLGSLSDGIYYGVLDPHLRISPLGDILLTDEFSNNVVEPMLSTAMGDRYVRSAPGQKRYYSAPTTVDSTVQLLEPEFVRAWDTEMGFTVDDARRMIDLLEDEGIERQTPVLSLTRSQLVKLLSSTCATDKVNQFLERFSLVSRPKWDIPPDGFKGREILPWRFGRRLSVVTRPILQVDLAEDSLFMVAPSLVRTGFFYVLRGAHSGTIDQEFFSSPAMRDAWWGKANEGHTFNAEVAQKLRNAGWQTEENIEISAILKRKLERDYGDVDVLAWRDGVDEVLVIECKDLTFRRNYSEIAALLSDYRGERKNGKPDKLLRHLNRVDRLEQSLLELGRYTGIDAPKIKSCLVVGGLVPMQFASVPALQGTFVGDAEALLTLLDPPIGQGQEPNDGEAPC